MYLEGGMLNTIMTQFKKISLPICIKTFGGTALSITFIWWTIVSFIKYKGEPTSTEITFTGKSFSEALILASTNPQYDKRLFIELRVQYKNITNSEHVVHVNCSECQNKKQFMYTTSYSEKDLPVQLVMVN
jgi:hypothetical protein